MTIDVTARLLANLYDTCDRCGELTGDLWPTIALEPRPVPHLLHGPGR